MNFYAIGAYWGHCGIEPHVLRMAKRHDLCAPKIARYLSPDSVQIFFNLAPH